jgi:leader peptidase (prepilin peptidase)/N-methyltransferase
MRRHHISRRRESSQNALDFIYECGLFVLGLVFGSFLNVCISRIPHDKSVMAPRSHCPSCGAHIRWRDNVPLLSWIFLRGRCRNCHKKISPRYPAVELLTAIMFLACYLCFGRTWYAVKFCVFSFLLVGLLFMDAETGLLPREFTYTGIGLGLAFSWIAPTDHSLAQLIVHAYGGQFSTLQVSLLDSAAGAFAGAAFFFIASGLYFLMRKRQGMGGGDFALIAMSGAFLGLKLTLLVIFAAPLIATIYALALMARHDRAYLGEMLQTLKIPFGVFISVCSLAAAFFGESVWRWYLSFF